MVTVPILKKEDVFCSSQKSARCLFVKAIHQLCPIVGLLLSARHLDQQAQVQGIAYHAAWDELETLRAQVAGNRLLTTQSSFPIADSITQNYPTELLTGTYSVTSVPGLGDATHSVQQIAVQVSWKNSSAAGTPVSSERISTYLSTGAGQ